MEDKNLNDLLAANKALNRLVPPEEREPQTKEEVIIKQALHDIHIFEGMLEKVPLAMKSQIQDQINNLHQLLLKTQNANPKDSG